VVIFNCIQLVNAIRILINPFIPNASNKLSSNLGLENVVPELNKDQFSFTKLDLQSIKLVENLLPLFKKIEDEDITAYNA